MTECPTPHKRQHTKISVRQARARGDKRTDYRCACGYRHFTSWAAGDYARREADTLPAEAGSDGLADVGFA